LAHGLKTIGITSNVAFYTPKARKSSNYFYLLVNIIMEYSKLEQDLGQVYDKAVETLKSEISQAQKS
jgi:hypothetical protein